MNEEPLDWSIHGVFDENGRITYHTHGLAAINNGLEIEVTLNVTTTQGAQFINSIGRAIAEDGLVLKDGEMVDSVFTVPFYVSRSKCVCHPAEDVLRIIFPDANGKFPWDEGVEEQFGRQTENDGYCKTCVPDESCGECEGGARA